MDINQYKDSRKPLKKVLTIPPRFEGTALEIDNQWCKDWVLQAVNGRVKKSPMLAGATGVGKTYQLYAMANEICNIVNQRNIDEWNKIIDYTSPVYKYPRMKIITEVDLFYRMREAPNQQAEWHLLKDIRTIDILLIDDIGTANAGNKALETLFNILDWRGKNCLATVITTNMTIQEIAQGYGEKIASRIIEMCKVIIMNGEDYRVKDNI